MGQSKTAKSAFSRRQLVAGAIGIPALAASGGLFWLSRTDVSRHDGKSRAKALKTDNTLPAEVDVVVVGGGIIGVATALALAETGTRVALCEKGVIAGEASSRAMGYIDSQLADPVRFPLMARNRQLWRQANARAGGDTGYRENGILVPLGSPEEESGAEDWIKSTRGFAEIDGKILTAGETLALFPGMREPPAAALLTPQDGSVEPRLAAPVLAEAAIAKGARLLQGCAVRGIEFSGGKPSAVITEKGPIRCHTVVVAGGFWTPLLLKSIGIDYDQFDIHLSMMEVGNVEGPRLPISAPDYGFRPQIDGRYSVGVVDFAAPVTPKTLRSFRQLAPSISAFWPIAHPGLSIRQFWGELIQPRTWPLDQPSPFEATRILTPAFRGKPLEGGLQRLASHFAPFASARITDQWAGVISTTADNLPVISEVPGKPGIYIGSGFSYGLTYGLAAGEALAELALGKTPTVDLAPYALPRFSSGKPIRYHA